MANEDRTAACLCLASSKTWAGFRVSASYSSDSCSASSSYASMSILRKAEAIEFLVEGLGHSLKIYKADAKQLKMNLGQKDLTHFIEQWGASSATTRIKQGRMY